MGSMLEGNRSFLLVASHLPHLGDAIEALWGEPDFSEFMQELLTPAMDGHGWPGDIRSALQALVLDHEMAFPKFTDTDNDI
jgi:hypothetical protein